ncbi:MAG: nucleotidyltransferase [Lactobacillus sp.]|nr:nucleotidyltransferase [Lactobacillus sp.]
MYDYKYEPHRLIFMIDNKSFFASCEAIRLGLNPMKAVLAVFSKNEGAPFGSGLIMAASPLAKSKYGLKNVMRARDLPKYGADLQFVEPHMNLYIEMSMKVLKIFQKYAAPEDIHAYSIDESMLDMTKSWHLFADDPYYVARMIQKDIRNTLGLYTTCGIGENPLLAKLSMDLEAKHRKSMLAYWHYLDVPDKLWTVNELESVWSINTKTADKLRSMGIYNMYDLAHYDPYKLHDRFGVIGDRLFALSWGVDRSIISKKYHPRNQSYGNSQILPKNYEKKSEIKTVISEIGAQVAARLRAKHVQAGLVYLSVGNRYQHTGFQAQMTISPTNLTNQIVEPLLTLFDRKWDGSGVRQIAVSCGNLLADDYQQLSIFNSPEKEIAERTKDFVIDDIRKKHGFKAIMKASNLMPGATALERSNLVGGHNGGNAYD